MTLAPDLATLRHLRPLYGEVKLRVDYVFKGQPAVRGIFSF